MELKGRIIATSPEGIIGHIPEKSLPEALKRGFKVGMGHGGAQERPGEHEGSNTTETSAKGVNSPHRSKECGESASETPVHKNASTQVNLPFDAASRVKGAALTIPDRHLAPDTTKHADGASGREEQPHITVKYGVHDRAAEMLRDKLAKVRPFKATLGKIKTFPPSENSEGRAVVHAEVHSPELHDLHHLVAQHVGNKKDDFDYKPHVTLAYVKPEVAHKYEGRTDLQGVKVHVRSIHVSQRDGKMVEIPLGGSSNKLPFARKGNRASV